MNSLLKFLDWLKENLGWISIVAAALLTFVVAKEREGVKNVKAPSKSEPSESLLPLIPSKSFYEWWQKERDAAAHQAAPPKEMPKLQTSREVDLT